MSLFQHQNFDVDSTLKFIRVFFFNNESLSNQHWNNVDFFTKYTKALKNRRWIIDNYSTAIFQCFCILCEKVNIVSVSIRQRFIVKKKPLMNFNVAFSTLKFWCWFNIEIARCVEFFFSDFVRRKFCLFYIFNISQYLFIYIFIFWQIRWWHHRVTDRKNKEFHSVEKRYKVRISKIVMKGSVLRATFTNVATVTSHLVRKKTKKRHEMTHTGDKPYQCIYCNKSFIHMGNKNVHEMTHTGEKPYQCSYCNKSFIHKGAKNRHEMTHTGEKTPPM